MHDTHLGFAQLEQFGVKNLSAGFATSFATPAGMTSIRRHHPSPTEATLPNHLLQGTGKLDRVVTADWTAPTIDSWRHSIWVGVWNPWPVILKLNPVVWYKVVREIVTLERMHRAFDSGLMQYGMMKAVKKQP